MWSFRTAVNLRAAARSAASAPSEGFGFRAPPVADAARKASRCRPQVRERIAEARAENGEGAKLAFAFVSGKSKRLRERIPDQLMLWHTRERNGGAASAPSEEGAVKPFSF